MLKRKFLLACGLAAFLLPQLALADELKIKLGSDGAYPPYSSKTASGELEGFEIDLAADLCKRIKAQCEWVLMDFDGLIPALQTGRFDAIMASLSSTKKRRKTIDFSVPYMSGPEYMVTSEGFAKASPPVGEGIVELTDSDTGDKTLLQGLAKKLSGKAIGVGRGTTLALFVDQYFPNAKMRLYDKETDILLDLVAGRVDLGLVDGDVTDKFIVDQKKEGKSFVIYGPGFRGGLLGTGIAFGLPKGKNDDLRKRLNLAILAATEDGTVTKLASKWFSTASDWSIPVDRLRNMVAQ